MAEPGFKPEFSRRYPVFLITTFSCSLYIQGSTSWLWILEYVYFSFNNDKKKTDKLTTCKAFNTILPSLYSLSHFLPFSITMDIYVKTYLHLRGSPSFLDVYSPTATTILWHSHHKGWLAEKPETHSFTSQ